MNTRPPNNDRQPLSMEAIAKLLTRATQQLDTDTVTALRRARDAALERQSQRKHVFALSTGRGAHSLIPHSTHQWVAVAILFVAILFGGINYWHHTQEHDLGHLDAEILIDDLPLEVFVD
ncbi:MAG: DUF3619 family protein [Gallionella sp.]|nr:DUF3619 family protein [Gallionella sp.]